MVSFVFKIVFIIGLFFPLSCTHHAWKTKNRDIAQSSANRIRSSRGRDQILVYRKNVRPYLMNIEIPNSFSIDSTEDTDELSRLKDFLLSKKTTLGMNADNDDYQLVLRHVRVMGEGRVVV